jgi:hypothetical protein
MKNVSGIGDELWVIDNGAVRKGYFRTFLESSLRDSNLPEFLRKT